MRSFCLLIFFLLLLSAVSYQASTDSTRHGMREAEHSQAQYPHSDPPLPDPSTMTLLELVNNKHHFTPDQFRRLFDAHETIRSLPLTANKEILAKAVIALRKSEGGTNTERANFVKETEHYLQMEVGLVKSNYIEQRWASTQIEHYNDSVRSMTKSGPKKQYRKRAASRYAKFKRIAEQEGTNEPETRTSDVESSASEDDNALVGEDRTLQQLFFNKPKHRSERNSYFRKVDRNPEFQELLQHRGETLPKAVAAYVFAQGLEGSKLRIFRDELNLHLLPHVKYAGIKLIKEEWERQQDAKFKKRHAEATRRRENFRKGQAPAQALARIGERTEDNVEQSSGTDLTSSSAANGWRRLYDNGELEHLSPFTYYDSPEHDSLSDVPQATWNSYPGTYTSSDQHYGSSSAQPSTGRPLGDNIE